MEADIVIFCHQCGAKLPILRVDTADAEGLQWDILHRLIEHRGHCVYYQDRPDAAYDQTRLSTVKGDRN